MHFRADIVHNIAIIQNYEPSGAFLKLNLGCVGPDGSGEPIKFYDPDVLQFEIDFTEEGSATTSVSLPLTPKRRDKQEA